MINEYSCILVEVFLALFSAFYCKRKSKENFQVMITWKNFENHIIEFMLLFVFAFMYIVNIDKFDSLGKILGYCLSILMMIVILFFVLAALLRFILCVFKETTFIKLHFIRNLTQILTELDIEVLMQLNQMMSISYHFMLLFSLGSMIVIYLTDYLLQYYPVVTELHLFMIAPTLVLFFVILTSSLWMLETWMILILMKRISNRVSEEEKKKIQQVIIKNRIKKDQYLE